MQHAFNCRLGRWMVDFFIYSLIWQLCLTNVIMYSSMSFLTTDNLHNALIPNLSGSRTGKSFFELAPFRVAPPRSLWVVVVRRWIWSKKNGWNSFYDRRQRLHRSGDGPAQNLARRGRACIPTLSLRENPASLSCLPQ